MKDIYTTRLSSTQKQQIKNLLSACRQAEPLTLSAPLEDDLDYFLLYDGNVLCTMLFLFFPEPDICECAAFTHPDYRRKGCFSRLLEKALEYTKACEATLGHPIDFCFLTDSKTPSASFVLKALSAEYWYSEHKMERHLTRHDRCHQSSLQIKDAGDHIYTASVNNQMIGTCITLPTGKNIYLYGFEIKENLRRHGYGEDFLRSMLAFLSGEGYETVSLQVSGQNLAALSLYKKTGFRITDTLSYYLY